MQPGRIIVKYEGDDPGPLLICFGGVHGNEPAGVKALEKVAHLLEIEPTLNKEFGFSGTLLGLRGNLNGLLQNERFIDKDLNRIWDPEYISKIKSANVESLDNEDRDLLDMLHVIYQTIEEVQPTQIVFLDIHTTSADGGIFTIVTDDEESHRLGIELHAPVITGMLNGLTASTLHYFIPDNFGIDTVGVCFEAGQHVDPVSIDNATAAIINCMRSIGSVDPDHVENKHDEQLIENSKNLPKIGHLVDKHTLRRHDEFFMLPGYQNFQKVSKGEVLAFDETGPIRASDNGFILMPFYQRQGEDGFFLIKLIEGF